MKSLNALLTTVLLAPMAHSLELGCKTVFEQRQKASPDAPRSLRRAPTVVGKRGVLPDQELRRWPLQNFISENRVWRLIGHQGITTVQEILLPFSFTDSEAEVIEKILLYATSPRAKELSLERYRRHPEMIQASKKTPQVLQDLVQTKGIEVGFWMIKLNSGEELTSPLLTSYLYDRILRPDVRHSYQRLQERLLEQGYTLKDILAVQFFHNHPEFGSPLSIEDINSMRWLKQQFQLRGLLDVGVHMYAVSRRRGDWIAFHSGL
jgi:hypothetical protein